MFESLRENYSAEVDLVLVAGGNRIPLSKIGPGYAVLETPHEFEKGAAELIMTVDGYARTWRIEIAEDAVPFDDTVHFRDAS